VNEVAQRLQLAASTTAAVARSLAHPDRRNRPSTYPLTAQERARIEIRWPERYGWAPATVWVERLRSEIAHRVRLTRAAIEQPLEGVVLIEVVLDGGAHVVAIDYSDYDRVLDEVLDRCALVFKMQHRVGGYPSERIVPGGYVPSRRYLRALLPGLRHLRDHGPRQFEVYGRFGPGYAQEVRGEAVRALNEQRIFPYEGALALRPYPSYLREAALSRICIDLPGNGEFCHRLVEYLALGCCVVRPPTSVRFPVPLRDGTEIVYAADHEEGLVRACAELLEQPGRVQEISRGAREYYDAQLRDRQLADYYLRRCLDRLTA
jgi:hypothetical protein